jgi:hypothetical protein
MLALLVSTFLVFGDPGGWWQQDGARIAAAHEEPGRPPGPGVLVAQPTNPPRGGDTLAAPPTSTPTPRVRATDTPVPKRATDTPVPARATSTPPPAATVQREDLPVTGPTATPTLPVFAIPVTATPIVPDLDASGNEPPAQTGDVGLVKIDLIQAVSQPAFSDTNPVPLVAGKESLVRVWVLVDADVDRQVLVTLQAKHNGQVMESCGPGTTAATKTIEHALNDDNLEAWTEDNLMRTVNFHLPPGCDWLDAGFVELTATVEGLECPTCDWNNTITRIFPVWDVRNVRIKLSLVDYYYPGSPNDGKVPTLTEALNGFDYFLSAYPTSNVDFVALGSWSTRPPISELNAIDLDTDPFSDNWWTNYIALRDWFHYTNFDGELGIDSHFGLLDQDVVGCGGVAGWDVFLGGAGCGGTYVHEGGHNFGLPHASNAHEECDGGDCDPDWPFSHGRLNGVGWNALKPDKLIVPNFSNGTHAHDSMSYGDCAAAAPTYDGELATYCAGWLSTLNYGRIGQRLRCADPQGTLDFDNLADLNCWQQDIFHELLEVPSPTPGPGPDPGHDPVGPTDEGSFQGASIGAPRPLAQVPASDATPGDDLVRVNGVIRADGTTELWPSYVGPTVGHPSVGASGTHAILLLGPNDTILGRHFFEPEPIAVHVPQKHWTFDETLLWHPDTQRLVLMAGDEVLAERPVSPSAPEVRLLAPNGGEALPGQSDEIQIVWEASDPDGDPLKYWLEYSADGGQSWRTLATNLEETRHTVKSWELPGSERALLRVHATDGIRTTTDVSDALFRVEKKPPMMGILGLDGRTEMVAGQPLVLRGLGVDPDGGMVPVESLAWTSDRDGALGQGEMVQLSRLSPGQHRLTLTGADRDGAVGQATVEMNVVPAALPRG